MQKQISFKSDKGYLLKGVLHLPSGKGPWPAVIVQHGFKSNYESSLIKKIAVNLEKSGFVVLRFSFSGHKPSGGAYKDVLVSQFVKDIKQALKFLSKQANVNHERIGIVGHSMGAFTSLLSANIYPKQIKTVVSISSLYDEQAVLKSYYRDGKVKESNKDYWEISGFKVTTKHFTDRPYLKKKFLIRGIHCPALIIHGDKDTRVDVKDAGNIYQLVDGPKELKIIKGADHNFTNQCYLDRVIKSTTKWFKEYLVSTD